MHVVAGGVAGLVVAGFWILDHLGWVPLARWRTLIARVAFVPLLISVWFVPSAFNAGVEWFVERKTNEMLERIQPMLDDLTPTSNPESFVDG